MKMVRVYLNYSFLSIELTISVLKMGTLGNNNINNNLISVTLRIIVTEMESVSQFLLNLFNIFTCFNLVD